jgi:hypothetical protein
VEYEREYKEGIRQGNWKSKVTITIG